MSTESQPVLPNLLPKAVRITVTKSLVTWNSHKSIFYTFFNRLERLELNSRFGRIVRFGRV